MGADIISCHLKAATSRRSYLKVILMVTVYTVKEEQPVVLFEESGEKTVCGLLISREAGALQVILAGRNKKDVFNTQKAIFVDLGAGLYTTCPPPPSHYLTSQGMVVVYQPLYPSDFLDRLLDEILKEPAQFMMEKAGEDSSGIVVLACYHPYLIRAIGDDFHGFLIDLLLKSDEIRREALNSSAVWLLSYGLFVLIPCQDYIPLSNEGASLFRKGIILHEKNEQGDDIYYCASNHPFYHDFFLLAKLNPSIAKHHLKMAAKEGIDAAYPIMHQMLDKEIREKGIEGLYDSDRWLLI